MTERDRVLRELVARAKKAGRRVFGFSSAKASCAELAAKRPVPEEWDYVCVEGDRGWTPLPIDPPAEDEERAA